MPKKCQDNGFFVIRVSLNHSKPPIWRKLAVPGDTTLDQLHEIIQIAMGWFDGHLHQFRLRDKNLKPSPKEIARCLQQGELDDAFLDRVGGQRFFVTKVTPWGDPTDMEGEDEKSVTLSEVCPKIKSKLFYEYDFGDGWEHTIEVQKIIDAEPGVEYPVCLGGKMACPPEDCGGIWGYYNLLEVLADPKHPEHEDLRDWLGQDFDSDAFDLEEVNGDLASWRS